MPHQSISSVCQSLTEDPGTPSAARKRAAAIVFPDPPVLPLPKRPKIDAVDSQVSPHAAKQYGTVLKDVFGVDTFRKNQLQAIVKTMAGEDLVVLMPTGGGKSLCYQLPAVFRNNKSQVVTVVVSPLLSLIQDQVTSLRSKKVDAVAFNLEADANTYTRLSETKPPALLYITPEKLQQSLPQRALQGLYDAGRLALFAVDEAHCITAWGHEFRDSYRGLDILRKKFPDVPIMALTSTATSRTIADIASSLKLKNWAILRQSVNRPNLKYTVSPKHNIGELVKFIKKGHMAETGIIYVTSCSRSEHVAGSLRKSDISARHYHAKMSDADRVSVQADWQSGKCLVMVATIAFGLGIDKPDVRFVIHYDLPKSLENYFQETGRAGRDGLDAECVLYYSYADRKKILNLASFNDGDSSRLLVAQRAVDAMIEYCENQSHCRRVPLLRYFGEKFGERNCGDRCDCCATCGLLVYRVLTAAAKSACAIAESMSTNPFETVTLTQCIAIFRGAKTKEMKNKGWSTHAQCGAGRNLSQVTTVLLFRKLLYFKVLVEHKVMKNGYPQYYLKVAFPRSNWRPLVNQLRWGPKQPISWKMGVWSYDCPPWKTKRERTIFEGHKWVHLTPKSRKILASRFDVL
ncbi:P-loop containing nucleoside triphosphate hydrolase protein [Mycena crocata]|nr:P-loop containing nucleoside triphosphate hydrolase protein [Mycena crocata]